MHWAKMGLFGRLFLEFWGAFWGVEIGFFFL
jgi:hypothetical protein